MTKPNLTLEIDTGSERPEEENFSEDASVDIEFTHPTAFEFVATVEPDYVRASMTQEMAEKVKNKILTTNEYNEGAFGTLLEQYSLLFDNYKKLEERYNSDIGKYYNLTNTLLETIKSFKYFNEEIHKNSSRGGVDYIIDYFDRMIFWLQDNDTELQYYMETGTDINQLHEKDMNKYKTFILELIFNCKEVKDKYIHKVESQDESYQFFDFEALKRLKDYYDSLPSLLRKLSEIFNNSEIKKLCGDTGENDQKSTQRNDSENPSPQSNQKSQESLLSNTYLEDLRAELISRNKNEATSQNRPIVNSMRLKALDESIQSIGENDLYKYNESLKKLQMEETENSTHSNQESSHKNISNARLKAYIEDRSSLKNLVIDLQREPNMEKKISAWEYKCRNREELESHDVKLEDLLKVRMSDSVNSLAECVKNVSAQKIVFNQSSNDKKRTTNVTKMLNMNNDLELDESIHSADMINSTEKQNDITNSQREMNSNSSRNNKYLKDYNSKAMTDRESYKESSVEKVDPTINSVQRVSNPDLELNVRDDAFPQMSSIQRNEDANEDFNELNQSQRSKKQDLLERMSDNDKFKKIEASINANKSKRESMEELKRNLSSDFNNSSNKNANNKEKIKMSSSKKVYKNNSSEQENGRISRSNSNNSHKSGLSKKYSRNSSEHDIEETTNKKEKANINKNTNDSVIMADTSFKKNINISNTTNFKDTFMLSNDRNESHSFCDNRITYIQDHSDNKLEVVQETDRDTKPLIEVPEDCDNNSNNLNTLKSDDPVNTFNTHTNPVSPNFPASSPLAQNNMINININQGGNSPIPMININVNQNVPKKKEQNHDILTNPTLVKRSKIKRKEDPVRESIKNQAMRSKMMAKNNNYNRPFSNPRDVVKSKLENKYAEDHNDMPVREFLTSANFDNRNNDFKSPDVKYIYKFNESSMEASMDARSKSANYEQYKRTKGKHPKTATNRSQIHSNPSSRLSSKIKPKKPKNFNFSDRQCVSLRESEHDIPTRPSSVRRRFVSPMGIETRVPEQDPLMKPISNRRSTSRDNKDKQDNQRNAQSDLSSYADKDFKNNEFDQFIKYKVDYNLSEREMNLVKKVKKDSSVRKTRKNKEEIFKKIEKTFQNKVKANIYNPPGQKLANKDYISNKMRISSNRSNSSIQNSFRQKKWEEDESKHEEIKFEIEYK